MNKKIQNLIKIFLLFTLIVAFVPAHSQDTESKYKQAIELGDKYFSESDFLNAKASYQVAAQIKPDEEYPRERLQESIRLLRIQMQTMGLYNEKLEFADELFDQRSYENAIVAYEEALKVMPSQEYPREQIKLIRQRQQEEAKKLAAFQQFMQTGDQQFTGKEYNDAIASYREAAVIFPDKKEVRDKIKAANDSLAQIAAMQSGYQKALSEAKMFHARKDYEKELEAYQRASELKPEEALPQIKIRELNEFLKKYEAYTMFVSQADELYIEQQFAEAREKYEAALKVLPDESYPKEIISKINMALAEKTEKNRAAYEEAIAKADALYNQEDYDAAMVAYSDALRYWPDGEHANKRIVRINEIMALKKAQDEAYANTISRADKLFAEKAYREAREEYDKANKINSFEQYPKVRIEEIDMILAELQNKIEQYESIIQGADKLFNVGDYRQARIQYLKAQELLSDRSYPVDQVKMIDEILGEERQIRDLYQEAIARADEHFANREWEDAKFDYVEANDLIPEEEYPDEKISEINQILAMLKAEQETYQLALKKADQLLAEKDYAAALREYQKAAEIFSEEEYPKMKIQEIEGLLATKEEQKILNENYKQSITDADQLLQDEKYAEAKAAYEKASGLKPAEQYPLDQIAVIDQTLKEIAQLQQREENYAGAISQADAYFDNEQYEEARAAYTEALEVKPGEAYPSERVSRIDEILTQIAARQALNDQYGQLIANADELFKSASYQEARAAYSEATSIKPEEDYPEQKIEEIDGILAAQAAEAEQLAQLEADYTAAISEADALFAREEFEDAKKYYQTALELKPAESYPQEKISEIDATMATLEQQRILEENYAETIEEADRLLEDENYAEAKAAYQEAAALKPAEEYPAAQITAINTTLAEIARLQGIEESYKAAITRADEYFAQQDYEQARDAYNEALGIKAEESYPAERIEEINTTLEELARQEAIDEAYAQAIATADEHFSQKQFNEAKSAYAEAAGIKPGEDYPGQKIEEIDSILSAKAAEAERLAQLEADYTAAISEADALFAREEFEDAKKYYQAALELKPAEGYPKEKISEIDATMATLEQQRILEENYAAAIEEADRLLEDENYAEAKAAYQEAVALKPGEEYPAAQITAIDATLAEIARLQNLQENYNDALTRADQHLASEDYEKARTAYTEAASLKPDESYPAEKITEIDAVLAEIARQQAIDQEYTETIEQADQLLADERYAEARATFEDANEIKPEEAYPVDKIREIDALVREQARIADQNEQYTTAISTADNFFAEEKYALAREAYQRATEIKTGEAYPGQRITAIDSLLAAREQQQQLEENYANAMARGESHLVNKEYEQARTEFEQALALKPEEALPAEKIAEIDGILTELARQQEIDEAYNAAIALAEASLEKQDYIAARDALNEAIEVKPEDLYAQTKLDEVNTVIEEMEQQKSMEENYARLIAEGDRAMTAGDYTSARDAYAEALAIKADEAYPAEKINEIEAILLEQARLLAIEKAYKQSIASADSLLALREYEGAKQKYTEAAQIKEDSDDYPYTKIEEIDAILAEIEKQRILDESYAGAIKSGDQKLETNNFLEALQFYEEAARLKPGEDYPSSQIAMINSKLELLEEERNKAYSTAIAQADNYYELGNYRSAKAAYQTAVNIKSDEQYARERLEEVTKLYAAELESLRVDYQKYVADADNYFKNKVYDGAIENYRLAAALLPEEDYPGKMISRITQIINDNAITDVNKLAQVIPNNTDRRFDFPELPVNVRKQNYILIKARNMSDKDFKMLVNFGVDDSKTGGVVLQVPKGQEVKDYIIRIGALYRWFSEDNNWLSIYPEGGDIEVSLVRISKSD